MTAEAKITAIATWRAGVLSAFQPRRVKNRPANALARTLEAADLLELEQDYTAWNKAEAAATAAGMPPIGSEPFNLRDEELGEAWREERK